MTNATAHHAVVVPLAEVPRGSAGYFTVSSNRTLTAALLDDGVWYGPEGRITPNASWPFTSNSGPLNDAAFRASIIEELNGTVSAEGDPEVRFVITKKQAGAIVGALIEKALDVERYLTSYPEIQAEDLIEEGCCSRCDGDRFVQLDSIRGRKALLAQLDLINQTKGIFETIEAA